jgi:AMMECR1 domain-containing protein
LSIEISRLTEPEKLDYGAPRDLLTLLHPHIDGVVLRDGHRRATFLPQVWEKVDTVEEFLEHLSRKMGAPSDYWRRKKLEVFTYRVEMFCE